MRSYTKNSFPFEAISTNRTSSIQWLCQVRVYPQKCSNRTDQVDYLTKYKSLKLKLIPKLYLVK